MDIASIYTETHNNWEDNIRPRVVAQYGENDTPALAESWNDFTDSEISNQLLLHYAPAFDETMPDDAVEHVIDCMGFTVVNNKEGDAYACTISRANRTGSAVVMMDSDATASDAVHTIVMACDAHAQCGTFAEWCDYLGEDEDCDSAKARYTASKANCEAFKDMLGRDEYHSLLELMEEV